MPARDDPTAGESSSGEAAGDAGATHLQTEAAAAGSLPPDVGPYRIREHLGEGGFGDVYVAEQLRPVRRRVALKILKAGMDTKAVLARFEAERQALALMDHPNIAKVLDAGETERGLPYFVMELVKGEPITTYCDRHSLPTAERLELFRLVCHAVQHAHQKGIIHRDLKPANILVSVADGLPVPKVIDFGIAKATGGPLTERTVFTQQGQLMGTPEYMSPEQAEMGGLDVDTRTDVYSLGVVLYELLTGALPFEPETLRSKGYAEIQRVLREKEPPRPSTRVSVRPTTTSGTAAARPRTDVRSLTKQLKGDLDWVILKAMEKDRTRRYETANSLAVEVHRYLSDEPVLAGPPSAAYRFRKFAKRNKVAIAVAGAVLFGIVAAAASLTYALLESNRQRARAEEARDESEAVTEFLAGMLAAVDPGERGREVTVREVLDAAARTIDEEFPDQPLIEARLRSTIGATYQALGEYSEAEPHLRFALETREIELGPESPVTLRSAHELAELFHYQGRYEEAAARFRETLRIQRRVLGDEDPETLMSLNNLAALCQLQGRYDEAESLYVETLDVRRRVLGDEDRETLVTRNNLASLYNSLGRHEDAEPLFAEIVEIQTRVLGREHPETLNSMNNLSVVYSNQGRYDDAEPLKVEALEIRRRVLGENHPATLASQHGLANLYGRQGRHERAESLYRETLEAQRRELGDEHPDVLVTANNLAALYMDLDRHDEAEPLLRRAIATAKRTFPAGHPYTGLFSRRLGECLLEAGAYPEAEEVLLGAHEILQGSLGSEHPATAATVTNLVSLYEAWGKPESAAAWRAPAADSPAESP